MQTSKLKHIGNEKEVKALKILQGEYEYVVRVPMSLLPFDIIALDTSKGEIVFVEVKSPHSELSPRQEYFKNMIESRNEWKVKYMVMYV